MPPSFCVTGGRPLKGTIRPAGNKNAALPILAATLLADGPCRIDNVPRIRDVETMLELLAHLGAAVRWLGPNSVEVDTARAEPRELDAALCGRIGASILLAGPMLARFGRLSLPPPGGDVIGRRRVDTHFLAFERLGANITVGATYQLEAKHLAGADIFLDQPSVTATENALMAAGPLRAPRAGSGAVPDRLGRRHRRDRDQHPYRRRRHRAHRPGPVRGRARPHRDRLLYRPGGRDQRQLDDRGGAARGLAGGAPRLRAAGRAAATRGHAAHRGRGAGAPHPRRPRRPCAQARGWSVAGLPRRFDVHRHRGRVAVRRAAARVREAVRITPLLRG